MDFLTRISELAARIRARMTAGTTELQTSLDATKMELADTVDEVLRVQAERDVALELLEDLAGPAPEEPAPEPVEEPAPEPVPEEPVPEEPAK